MAGAIRSDPFRGASKLTGRSNVRTTEATKYSARVKRIAGVLGVPSRSDLGEGQCRPPRGRRGRHVRTEWSVKARIRSRVASALPHGEGSAYKPLCGEVALCPR